jgi:hypothetical protein
MQGYNMFTKEWVKEKLSQMGYAPKEFGENFRMSAIYRGGNTNSSLSVHCNSGRFTDFGNNNLSGSFEELIKLTVGSISEEEIKKIIEGAKTIKVESNPAKRLKDEQIYSKDYLIKLLPSYDYYLKKGIKEDVLKQYYCGYSSDDKLKLYKRITFPIFNKNSQIHGFSGRHILWDKESLFPKWKHTGVKKSWIYPIYLPDRKNNSFPFLKSVQEKKEIILVESIGDSMALTQQGILNHMVTFGLELSPKQVAFLSSLNLNKIIISTNNDNTKVQNHGAISAIQIYLKLLSEFIDSDKLFIALPLSNDFFDALVENKSIEEWYDKKVNNFNKNKSIKYIISLLQKDKLAAKKDKCFKKHYLDMIPMLEAII